MQKSVLILMVVAVAFFSYLGFEQVKISKKAQYTEQFLKSVEQLASKDLGVLLGGLASLDDLSRVNKEEYRRVWKHLGNFLRHHKPLQPKAETPYPEVRAISQMLRERNTDYEDENFRLNLSGADLYKANLSRVNLISVNLWGADLWGADLEEANLREANLSRASLGGSNLEGSNLRGANLVGAWVVGADLKRADLYKANLERSNLMWASLDEASWSEANLFKLLFGGIEAQDLTNLTPEQLRGTYYDIEGPIPKLPEGISEEDKPKAISVDEWRAKYRGNL